MNIKTLLFALSAGLASSCSTAYRNTQTPDDVYYSPVRATEEEVRTERREEVKRYDPEQREIRMAMYDRRWRDFDDDYDYRYDPYKYGYSYGYYYNPYYCHYPVYITNVAITNPKNSVPRMTNLGSYNYNTNAISNTKYGSGVRVNTVRPYNNSNNNSFIRRILTTPVSTSTPTETYNSTRSYTPSSSNSSSSSGSSSSGGSVTRPKRGG